MTIISLRLFLKGITISLPGAESQDSERRRQIALRALSERLSKVKRDNYVIFMFFIMCVFIHIWTVPVLYTVQYNTMNLTTVRSAKSKPFTHFCFLLCTTFQKQTKNTSTQPKLIPTYNATHSLRQNVRLF